ncbi:MAG: poly-beta-1,6-N-acetyl-D-glucosamine N-deacetylase PgaB, partial [Gammaproteobacteria bacterium]|nr:poly-beta-1,6-N-acetyl-D-glucosamine N-deacetylase PgaB [Gammaproteobacteria bacterium]
MSAFDVRRVARICVAASLWAVVSLGAFAQPLPAPDPEDGVTFRAIALHDVRENVRASFDRHPEPTALDERTLAEFFAWLKISDSQPVSLQQIVDARAGGKPLPPRAVLLTFDDGYESVYTKVYPLLQRFRFPAVVALVTSWLEVPAGQPVATFGGPTPMRRESFLSWAQAREMAASGLVEFASHSDALHVGVLGNPQGNLQPAATTLVYDAASGGRERESVYLARIEADLRRSRELIEKRTASRVRAMVWPYGAYNQPALRAAERAGMPITLTLDEGPNTAQVPLKTIRRSLATYDMQIPALDALRTPAAPNPFAFNRAMHVDLDYVYDPDPAQQEANLSRLLDRVLAVGPSAVYLQAFADPDGNGVADSLYFPNRHLPMRADLFNRVAWQLRTRTGVQVYAWMPVMAFRLPAGDALSARRVEAVGIGPTSGERYERLSPFVPAVRTLIGDLYEDLARNAPVAGVLFHDDAALADDEDAGPAALDAYARWGLPRDIAAIRADPALAARWSEAKTRFLNDFTLELAGRMRVWQPTLLTARNLFARPLLEPASEAWFAQNYAQSLAAYDY